MPGPSPSTHAVGVRNDGKVRSPSGTEVPSFGADPWSMGFSILSDLQDENAQQRATKAWNSLRLLHWLCCMYGRFTLRYYKALGERFCRWVLGEDESVVDASKENRASSVLGMLLDALHNLWVSMQAVYELCKFLVKLFFVCVFNKGY